MIPTRNADLEYMLKNAPNGVPVTLGSCSTYGLVRRAGQEIATAGAVALADDEIEVVVATHRVPADFGTGDTLMLLLPRIGRKSYTVRRRFVVKDGEETLLHCVELT